MIREHYPDPTAGTGEPWVAVTTGAVEPLPKPVTLAAVKAEPKLKDMILAKYPRLSVQPVTADEWKLICKMGGMCGREDRQAAASSLTCAAICAKTFSLRVFERELRSLSANCSSTPSSKAFTTVSCT